MGDGCSVVSGSLSQSYPCGSLDICGAGLEEECEVHEDYGSSED